MGKPSEYAGATFVLGGTREEALLCLREIGLNPRNVSILNRPRQLIGTRGAKVIVCGNYHSRRDYQKFLDAFNRYEAFTKYWDASGQ